MKKTRFLAFGIVLLIACVFNGCSDNELASVPYEMLSQEGKRAYMKNEYKPIGLALATMAADPEFRAILYSEVEKKFDGDYNVLIENLVNIKTATGKTIREKMEAKIGEGSLTKALAMFNNLEGQAWYPQIFIPNYDVLKKNELIQGRGHGSSKPVPIILYDGDETKTVVNGYLPNENGELVESVFGIDEQYAMENEVWVISINESGIQPGQITSSTAKGEVSGARTTAFETAIIGSVTIKCHKESWIAGASEINILSIYAAQIYNDYHRIIYYNGGQYQGAKMHEFSRATVKDQNSVAVNFSLNPYWTDSQADYCDNIIFEYDAAPTATRAASWTHVDGTGLNLEFRSADSPYTVDVIYRPEFATTVVDNSCIKWRGKL